jgi:hypothetical protein
MRRGFLLVMLGLGALALFAALVIAPRVRTTSTAYPAPSTDSGRGSTAAADVAQSLETQTPEEANVASRAELPPTRPAATSHAKEVASQTEEPVVSTRDEQQQARVAARIAELGDLSTKTDRASLETLLSEVRNPDEEIRQAALDAITQSGNRAAIPGLREAAAQAQDTREKQALEDVIEFISLPTLTEILHGQSATNNYRPAPARP